MIDKLLNNPRVLALIGKTGTLKRQLSLAFLLVGLIPLVVLGTVSVVLTNNMAESQVIQNLESIKYNKKVAIENYGNTIVNQVLTTSSDPNVANNMQSIVGAFDNFKNELQSNTPSLSVSVMRERLSSYYNGQFLPQYKTLNDGQSVDASSLLNQLSDEAVALQYAYIQVNEAQLGSKDQMFASDFGTAYDTFHNNLHQQLSPFLNAFGYYDIFLVDMQGRVVYSVYKELDYATNLSSGPYSNSGLAQAFNASLSIPDANQYVLIDFAQYTPSYEAPASFIASPVMIGNTRLGSLIFQMPLDAISAVMSERNGLGETGESYLVGPDRLMRSDSIKFPEEFSVDASYRNQRTIASESVDSGFTGQTSVIQSHNYKGENVVSGHIPINFGGLEWVLIAEIERSEAYSDVVNLTLILLLVIAVVLVAIVFTASRNIRDILIPIDDLQSTMASIASKTDFSERVKVHNENEIGKSASSVNSLLEAVEVSINETNDVIGAMAQGDFSQRVESDFQGDLLSLKQGVNQSAEEMQNAIQSVNSVVESLAKGDFSNRITENLKGDLSSLKGSVNSSMDVIAHAMDSIKNMMQQMSEGQFKETADPQLTGDYHALASAVEGSMHVVDEALGEIDSVMEQVSKGQLDARIESTLPGQLDQIKQKVNLSVDAIVEVFSETERVLEAMSEGQLNITVDKAFPGRYQTLKQNIDTTLEKLTEVVQEIIYSASSVQTGAEEIAAANNDLNDRTTQQAGNLQQTAASMDEIASTVKNTANNADSANELSNKAKAYADKGGLVISNTVKAMEDINNASERIADIIGVIDSIAFQTNLLALNAAVEAARAGEQGRGFAVVATEVRNLAGRSANAAKEIKDLIEDSVSKVHTGSALVNESGETLQHIIQQVENVRQVVGEISNAATEQSAGVSEVHRAMESLQSLTQQNASMVEQATASSEELGGKANSMNSLMQFFKTASN